MDIYTYIREYGKYTFQEKPFNEVDGVVFSYIAYANCEEILNKNSKMTIKEVALNHIKTYKGKDKNIISVKEGNKILRYIMDAERYKDCLVYNYEYVGNNAVQFGVLSIEYEKNKVFVSYEGTDEMFSGWIENIMLSCEFPTISHKLAIKYLNKHYTFSNKELIVGGHSKGGNLALVASMYSNIFVKHRIKKIYNYDGPNLLEKEFKSKRYKKLSNKYTHIIPKCSIIGLLLYHNNDYIIDAIDIGILSHAINYWLIENDHFKISPKLTPLSKQFDIKFKEWFIKYTDEEKKDFVNNLSLILDRSDLTTLLELKNTRIIKLIHESKEMNPKTKEILLGFINLVIDSFKISKKEEIKNFMSNLLIKKNKQGEEK